MKVSSSMPVLNTHASLRRAGEYNFDSRDDVGLLPMPRPKPDECNEDAIDNTIDELPIVQQRTTRTQLARIMVLSWLFAAIQIVMCIVVIAVLYCTDWHNVLGIGNATEKLTEGIALMRNLTPLVKNVTRQLTTARQQLRLVEPLLRNVSQEMAHIIAVAHELGYQ